MYNIWKLNKDINDFSNVKLESELICSCTDKYCDNLVKLLNLDYDYLFLEYVSEDDEEDETDSY